MNFSLFHVKHLFKKWILTLFNAKYVFWGGSTKILSYRVFFSECAKLSHAKVLRSL